MRLNKNICEFVETTLKYKLIFFFVYLFALYLRVPSERVISYLCCIWKYLSGHRGGALCRPFSRPRSRLAVPRAVTTSPPANFHSKRSGEDLQQQSCHPSALLKTTAPWWEHSFLFRDLFESCRICNQQPPPKNLFRTTHSVLTSSTAPQ